MNQNELSKYLKQFDISHTVTDQQCFTLYQYASKCKDGVIVELGTGTGKSTLSLALGAVPTVYTVDPFIVPGSQESFNNNMVKAHFTGKVVSIHSTSIVASKTFGLPIGLMFIDADHSYPMVKNDYERWSSKMIQNSTMIFHDYNEVHPGLCKYIDEIEIPKHIINQMVFIRF